MLLPTTIATALAATTILSPSVTPLATVSYGLNARIPSPTSTLVIVKPVDDLSNIDVKTFSDPSPAGITIVLEKDNSCKGGVEYIEPGYDAQKEFLPGSGDTFSHFLITRSLSQTEQLLFMDDHQNTIATFKAADVKSPLGACVPLDDSGTKAAKYFKIVNNVAANSARGLPISTTGGTAFTTSVSLPPLVTPPATKPDELDARGIVTSTSVSTAVVTVSGGPATPLGGPVDIGVWLETAEDCHGGFYYTGLTYNVPEPYELDKADQSITHVATNRTLASTEKLLILDENLNTVVTMGSEISPGWCTKVNNPEGARLKWIKVVHTSSGNAGRDVGPL